MSPLFFPPEPNRFVIGVTHLLSRGLTRLFKGISLRISEQDLSRLKSLSQQRVIYLVNHPSFNDPIVVMLLSAQMGKGFYYLASVEQFSGILGRYFQKIGTYSVRRGQSDRPSIKQTLALLSQPETHLVIFPEGGCSFQNDTVMPFRPGAIQMGFQALQRELKQAQTLGNCYIVPLALKYHYVNEMEPTIRQMLAGLEHALGLRPTSEQSGLERLRAIAVEVMTQIAGEYGFDPPEPSQPLQIDSLRLHILEACESALGIQANPQAFVRERTYQIEAALETVQAEPKAMSRALITRSVARLFNFNAMYPGYVAEKPTAERFIDTLTRLEREVFEIDRPQTKGRQVAQIGVGEVFNLKDDYENYVMNRAATIDHLTLQAQTSVQTQINNLGQGTKYLKF